MQISLQLFAFICLVLHAANVRCNDDKPLRIAYEWKEMNFNFFNTDERLTAIQNGIFIPNNVVPFGLEVYRDRVFITLPRWKKGVPASLAYFDIGENNTTQPILKPYPSWEAHNLMSEANPELVSPFRVRADRCGRLWVLDSRISCVLESTKFYGPPQILVYDIHNDNLLRRYIFPENHKKENSFFASLAVEDTNCDNTYAYAGDLGSPGLVVYSWSENDSWRVQHNFFHPDPLAGNFSINNIEFQWDDGLYGLALSREIGKNTTLYFHPLSSTMEFEVYTSILHNKIIATSGVIYHQFKQLGSRGPNGQSGASFLDKKTDILFFTLPNLNAVACWQTINTAYMLKEQNIISANDTALSFPSDLVVDDKERIWILSNRLHAFLYSTLEVDAGNFRILTGTVRDVIKKTACALQTNTIARTINNLRDFAKDVGKKQDKSGGSILELQKLLLLTVLGGMTLRTIFI